MVDNLNPFKLDKDIMRSWVLDQKSSQKIQLVAESNFLSQHHKLKYFSNWGWSSEVFFKSVSLEYF